MYLIVFHFDVEKLKNELGNDYLNISQAQISENMVYPFTKLDTFSYMGDESISPVQCVLVIQNLSEKLNWFSRCIFDARLLKIGSNEDLMLAIKKSVI
ncbi:hypothetical protein ACWIYZ_08595 [Ursidibacter arcticus]